MASGGALTFSNYFAKSPWMFALSNAKGFGRWETMSLSICSIFWCKRFEISVICFLLTGSFPEAWQKELSHSQMKLSKKSIAHNRNADAPLLGPSSTAFNKGCKASLEQKYWRELPGRGVWRGQIWGLFWCEDQTFARGSSWAGWSTGLGFPHDSAGSGNMLPMLRLLHET